MSKMDENISEILNMNPEPAAIIVRKDDSHLPKGVVVGMDEVDKDFQTARKNIKELISLGFNAIDGIMKVASEGDSPRAYEVVSQMIKTVAEANRDLVELHQRMKTIKQEKYEPTTVTNTSNSLFLGSTKDLLELMNPKRSFTKSVAESSVILDETKGLIDHDTEKTKQT
jgi:hypothetical protein